MKVIVWGNRGSIPVPGELTVKFGGNTSCIELEGDPNSTLIFDAGSGIRLLGKKIVKENRTREINIFITHKHWDHIQGLPFFPPLYKKGFKVNIYAPATTVEEVKNIISIQMLPQYFPVGEDIFNAKINYIPISENETFKFGNLFIEMIQTHHSRGTFSYKITEENKSIVFMTDNELYFDRSIEDPTLNSIEKLNQKFIEFCRGTDLLIHDTMYSPADYKFRRNWGHSCSNAVAYFAAISKVKRLMYFHYEPSYTDEALKVLCDETSKLVHSIDADLICIPSMQNLEITI